MTEPRYSVTPPEALTDEWLRTVSRSIAQDRDRIIDRARRMAFRAGLAAGLAGGVVLGWFGCTIVGWLS